MDEEYPAYSERGKCSSGFLARRAVQAGKGILNLCSNVLFTIETRLVGFLMTLCGVFFSLSSGIFFSCMMMKNSQEKAARPVGNRENALFNIFSPTFPKGQGLIL
jgi:hypothetical protein